MFPGRPLLAFVVLFVAAVACDSSARPGVIDGGASKDGGGADAASLSGDGGASKDGSGSDATSGGADAAMCAVLAARASALFVKDCTASDQCAVVSVYNCCNVYMGIRADRKAAFGSAQDEYDRACPDLRGCQCQDHTETNEPVPFQTPPLPVSATCDLGTCTAHQK